MPPVQVRQHATMGCIHQKPLPCLLEGQQEAGVMLWPLPCSTCAQRHHALLLKAIAYSPTCPPTSCTGQLSAINFSCAACARGGKPQARGSTARGATTTTHRIWQCRPLFPQALLQLLHGDGAAAVCVYGLEHLLQPHQVVGGQAAGKHLRGWREVEQGRSASGLMASAPHRALAGGLCAAACVAAG